MRDAQTYGNGLAQQNYQQYVSNLQPYLGASNTSATGIAAADSGLATGLNSNLMGQAGLNYQGQTGMGDAQASADLAKYNASGNMFGALMNGANLASKALPFLM